MPLNLGYIELGGGGVTIRVYYDTAWLDTDPTRNLEGAPLVDGPRGWCLDMTNTTGKNVKLTVFGQAGTSQVITVGQGDPVIAGPASGRSRSATQMAALGFTTRGNVGTITLE
jgi:hypothetical protein